MIITTGKTRQMRFLARESDEYARARKPPCITRYFNIDFSKEVVQLYVSEPLVKALLKAFMPKVRSEDAVQNEML